MSPMASGMIARLYLRHIQPDRIHPADERFQIDSNSGSVSRLIGGI